MPTLNSWNNQILDANVTLNGGTCSIGTDATSGAINIGTGAAARTTTLGNVTGATAVNVNTGTGGSAITTTNGTFAVSTGTGAVNIGTDATAKTITLGNGTGATSVVLNCGTGALNIGANAIARTTTLGCTTGAGVLALKYGTGDFTLASATGTIMLALDTGEITKPLQPAFTAKASAVNNVTGDGTTYTLVFDNEIFDQNSDFDGTSTFTAPVTGKYWFACKSSYQGILSTHISTDIGIITSNNSYYIVSVNPYNAMADSTLLGLTGSTLADMDAGDVATCTVKVQNGTKVIDITAGSYFSGYLVC